MTTRLRIPLFWPFTRMATRLQVERLGFHLFNQLEKILMDQKELAQALKDANAQAKKVAAEQAAALKKVEEKLNDAGSVSPEVQAALAELKSTIQTQDDLNPDSPSGSEGSDGGEGEGSNDAASKA